MPPAPSLDHDALALAAVISLTIIAGTALVATFCKRAKGPDDVTGLGKREPNLSTPVAVTREVHEFCPKCEMSVPHDDCIFGPPPKDAA